MKSLLLTIFAGVLAISAFSPDTASAKSKLPKAKPTPVPEKINAGGSKIQMVSGDSITIEYSKTSTAYKISGETQIDIDGKRARSSELRPGMSAEVEASRINPNLLLSIKAHAIPKS